MSKSKVAKSIQMMPKQAMMMSPKQMETMMAQERGMMKMPTSMKNKKRK